MKSTLENFKNINSESILRLQIETNATSEYVHNYVYYYHYCMVNDNMYGMVKISNRYNTVAALKEYFTLNYDKTECTDITFDSEESNNLKIHDDCINMLYNCTIVGYVMLSGSCKSPLNYTSF